MTELLTAAQMRAVERAAIEAGEVTGLELMERAGAGVVEAVFKEWPELAQGAHHAVVLCGPGNNGGDGFVVARLLTQAGWTVEVFLYGDANNLPPDAKVNFEKLAALGPVAALGRNTVHSGRADLVVDAVFGTGLTRPVKGELAEVLKRLSYVEYWNRGPRCVAVDLPSGLSSETGQVLGSAFRADLTVSFHAAKCGHYLANGPARCGKLLVADIGLRGAGGVPIGNPGDPGWILQPPERSKTPTARLVGAPRAVTKRGGHKFDHGHALILAGGSGRTGAARLAARGALRIGAGLVTLGVPPSAQIEVASQITAIMLARVADGDALAEVLQDIRVNALCLGPGLGLTERASTLVDAVLGGGHLRLTRRVVFDADALTLIAQDAGRMEALNAHAVLTPHGGEFARLFPDISQRLAAAPNGGAAYSKLDAVRDAAKQSGAVVLMKGADTVIAHPDGRASVHAAVYGRNAPWLATAGAGDVLAGFITGLLARGLEPMLAAESAAWLHVECARAFGPGLIAEDLPETLPQILRELEA
jgi:ADP-dependent NAD(P)H-hydrate dehydratase / NAD(P)H-hydrate epimerase